VVVSPFGVSTDRFFLRLVKTEEAHLAVSSSVLEIYFVSS